MPTLRDTCRLTPFPAAPGKTMTVAIVNLRQLEGCADVDRLARDVLAEAEWGIFTNFSRKKRKLEWLAGRLAAKCLLQAIHSGLEQREIAVLADAHGRPAFHLTGQGGVPIPHLSISHSGDTAAAVVSAEEPVGIDVQMVSNSVVNVREQFLSIEETLLQAEAPPFGRFSDRERLTLLWAAKEAVRKSFVCWPLPPLRKIEVVAIVADGDQPFVHGVCGGDAPFTVGVALQSDTAMALTCQPA